MTATAAFIAGFASLVLWAVLTFVMQVPSGWVHLPLAAGAALIAMGITLTRPAGDKS